MMLDSLVIDEILIIMMSGLNFLSVNPETEAVNTLMLIFEFLQAILAEIRFKPLQ